MPVKTNRAWSPGPEGAKDAAALEIGPRESGSAVPIMESLFMVAIEAQEQGVSLNRFLSLIFDSRGQR